MMSRVCPFSAAHTLRSKLGRSSVARYGSHRSGGNRPRRNGATFPSANPTTTTGVDREFGACMRSIPPFTFQPGFFTSKMTTVSGLISLAFRPDREALKPKLQAELPPFRPTRNGDWLVASVATPLSLNSRPVLASANCSPSHQLLARGKQPPFWAPYVFMPAKRLLAESELR